VTERWENKPELFNSFALLPALRQAFIGIEGRAEILALTAESPECSPPKNGLAVAYPGDGTAQDAIGGATLTSVGGVGFGPGRVGQAFVLDGQSGHLVAPWPGFNRFGLRDSSFAAYVKFSSVEGEMTILDRKPVARLAKALEHRFHFELATARAGSLDLFSTTAVVADRWYHVCVTKNNEEVVLYVNGNPEARESFRDAQPPVESREQLEFHFGATKDRQQFLHGKLDEILFYDRALSPTRSAGCTKCANQAPAEFDNLRLTPGGRSEVSGQTVALEGLVRRVDFSVEQTLFSRANLFQSRDPRKSFTFPTHNLARTPHLPRTLMS